MFKKLRIICSIIAALLAAACPFLFLYAGNSWGICSVVGVLTFFGLTVTFKKSQEEKEGTSENEAPKTGDYITGKIESDEDEPDNNNN